MFPEGCMSCMSCTRDRSFSRVRQVHTSTKRTPSDPLRHRQGRATFGGRDVSSTSICCVMKSYSMTEAPGVGVTETPLQRR